LPPGSQACKLADQDPSWDRVTAAHLRTVWHRCKTVHDMKVEARTGRIGSAGGLRRPYTSSPGQPEPAARPPAAPVSGYMHARILSFRQTFREFALSCRPTVRAANENGELRLC
jgi:hypothetical protein